MKTLPVPAPILALGLSLLALPAALAQQDGEDSVQNLKAIDQIYMEVKVEAPVEQDILNLQLELNDLVELELRRARIPFREAILNQPGKNYPKIIVRARVDRSGTRNHYQVTLQVMDYAVINRNKSQIVAETYRRTRTSSKPSDSFPLIDLKTEVRVLMTDFVADFRTANPGF